MTMPLIKPNERVDDLQFKGLRIIQNPEMFCFGTDSVLLASFVSAPRAARILDLGCGTGIFGLLLCGRYEDAHVVGVDIQSELCDMATRSAQLNALQDRFTVINEDIKNLTQSSVGVFDVAVCNPPYYTDGPKSENAARSSARHETQCSLSDICATLKRTLKFGGSFYMIYPAERLTDALCCLREYGIEPKLIRPVQSCAGALPSLVLLRAVHGARSGLAWEPPLIMYSGRGVYTGEMNRIYHKEV